MALVLSQSLLQRAKPVALRTTWYRLQSHVRSASGSRRPSSVAMATASAAFVGWSPQLKLHVVAQSWLDSAVVPSSTVWNAQPDRTSAAPNVTSP